MCPDRIAEEEAEENPAFLKEQIVTYLGNKRSLLDYIEAAVLQARALGRAETASGGFVLGFRHCGPPAQAACRAAGRQ